MGAGRRREHVVEWFNPSHADFYAPFSDKPLIVMPSYVDLSRP